VSYVGEVVGGRAGAYYRLGESSGTVAADSSGNGGDGTIAGSPLMGKRARWRPTPTWPFISTA